MLNHIEGFYHNADLAKYFSLSAGFFTHTNKMRLKAEVKNFGSLLFIKPPDDIRELIDSGDYIAMPVRGIDVREFDKTYKLTDKTTIGFYKVRG